MKSNYAHNKYGPNTLQGKLNASLLKTGNKNPNWKGNNVTKRSLHAWVQRHKFKPNLCEICKSVPPLDLANVSGQYKRDINDFIWICRRCHEISDGRITKLKKCKKNTKPMIDSKKNRYIEKCPLCKNMSETKEKMARHLAFHHKKKDIINFFNIKNYTTKTLPEIVSTIFSINIPNAPYIKEKHYSEKRKEYLKNYKRKL